MKRNRFVIMIIGIGLFGIIAYLLFFSDYLKNKEIADNENKAQWLITKIEEYKKTHHKIPQSIDDLKLNLPDDYPIDYAITNDSGVYVVGFQVEAFESMMYRSDLKKWIMQH